MHFYSLLQQMEQKCCLFKQIIYFYLNHYFDITIVLTFAKVFYFLVNVRLEGTLIQSQHLLGLLHLVNYMAIHQRLYFILIINEDLIIVIDIAHFLIAHVVEFGKDILYDIVNIIIVFIFYLIDLFILELFFLKLQFFKNTLFIINLTLKMLLFLVKLLSL